VIHAHVLGRLALSCCWNKKLPPKRSSDYYSTELPLGCFEGLLSVIKIAHSRSVLQQNQRQHNKFHFWREIWCLGLFDTPFC
jgi:hypothetical protein